MKKITLPLLCILAFGACEKNQESVDNTVPSRLLADFPSKIIVPNLLQMSDRAQVLSQQAVTFDASPSQAGHDAMKSQWYAIRDAWEQSESCLFGPVASLGLDPAIDDWPVSFNSLDSVLHSSDVFTDTYIDGLETTLKGFHPIEYILFGQGGTKTFTQITAREREYLLALTRHLARITAQMHHEWAPNGNNFAAQVTNAGTSGSQFSTKQQAVLEIANAMMGIVAEVADGKIKEPFDLIDPALEESPFSGNSFRDFTNNIRGARNVYTGQYLEQGASLSDFVKQYNRSLDTRIMQSLDASIANLESYNMPFGQAILNQRSALQSTMNQLKTTALLIENELLPLIQQRIRD